MGTGSEYCSVGCAGTCVLLSPMASLASGPLNRGGFVSYQIEESRNNPSRAMISPRCHYYLLFVSALLLLTAGIVYGVVTSWGRGGRDTRTARKLAGISLSCNQPSVDFGVLYRPVMDKIEHAFKIRNESSEMIRLRVKDRTCTCTNVEVTSDRVRPGEVAELRVTWNVPNLVGRPTLGVFLEAAKGDGEEWQRAMEVRGSVLVRDVFNVNPRSLDFGKIATGETKQETIVVNAPQGETLGSEVKVTVDGRTPEVAVNVKAETPYAKTVEVSVKGLAEKGVKDYRVQIETGRDKQPVIEVPVTARHIGEYTAKPEAVLLNVTHEDGVGTVEVRNNSGCRIDVEKIEVDAPSVLGVEQSQVSADTVQLKIMPKSGQDKKEQSAGEILVYIKGSSLPVGIKYLILW
jgi:hypothetical protein